MKLDRSTLRLAAALVATSVVLYALHFLAFHDARNLEFYTFMDVAFMPIEILIVSLIVNSALTARERAAKLHKLNMVIGAFFSEVGTELLGRMRAFDASFEHCRPFLLFKPEWTPEDYRRAEAELKAHQHDIELERGDVEGLRDYLAERRGFLLRLLENPNLLEHEAFTELLWGVFHLTEELLARTNLTDPPRPDKAHLEIDIRRAYTLLLCEWLEYVKHLQADYPYLFAFASRTNPFDPDARIEAA